MARRKNKKAANAPQVNSVSSGSAVKSNPNTALKPKAKIVKNTTTNNHFRAEKSGGTPQVLEKRNNKKKSLKGNSSTGEKLDGKTVNFGKVLNSTASNEHVDKNQQTHKTERKHDHPQKRQRNPNNREDRKVLGLESGRSRRVTDGSDKVQRREQKKGELGGMIFMCNAKTKPDVFGYGVMGLPLNKKEVVLGIKPGLELFLYDFDLRVMYGIYKASSHGGLFLEQSAFNGGFPAQVRFSVYKDCYPLPEEVFKEAIKENYKGVLKFETELTIEQVNKLVELFKPAELRPEARRVVSQPREAIQIRESYGTDLHRYEEVRRLSLLPHEIASHLPDRVIPVQERSVIPESTFLSEEEYRTYGLRREIPNPQPPSYTTVLEPYSPSHPLAPVIQNQPSLNEVDFQISRGASIRYGLQHSIPPGSTHSYSTHALYPSQSGALMVEPYQAHFRVDPVPTGSHTYIAKDYLPWGEAYPTLATNNSGRRASYLTEFDSLKRRESDALDRRARNLTDFDPLRRRESDDLGRMYSAYASHALSDYNRTHVHQEEMPKPHIAPVSSRYSFGGPSLTYH